MVEKILDFSAVLILLTAFAQLVAADYQMKIWLTAAQFLGVFLMLQRVWPLNLALALLISGWMATAALGMAHSSAASVGVMHDPASKTWEIDRRVASLVGIFVILLAASFAYSFTRWLPSLQWPLVFSGFILVGFGFLQTTFQQHLTATFSALMGIISGFAVIISGLSSSIFVAGMLGISILDLALIGAYLLQADTSRESKG